VKLWRTFGLAFSGCALALTAAAQGVTLPEARHVVLDNGTTIILIEKHDVPLIGLQAVIRGGAVSDPEGQAGLSSVLAGLLEKGAGERDAAAFAEAIDSIGGSLSASADLESITISGEFLARDADLMIELLATMLREPRLESAELTKLRDRRINLIRAAKDGDPRRLLPIYGSALLFSDHPYGTAVFGDETSLANIDARAVRGYYEDYVGADRLIIAIAGDFAADAMTEKLTAAFADWRPAAATLPEIEVPQQQPGRRVLLVDKPGATQAYFWIGNVGVDIGFEQRAELDIANTLFGGRFTSLLMDELRTKAGLTYSAGSALLRYSRGGSVAMSSYTKTESTVEAVDLALSLLQKIQLEGFADDLIASGKNYILGQYAPDFETAEQLAGQLAELEALGLDASFVNDYGAAVAAADGEAVRTVIDSVYPELDDLVFVIVGDAELIRGDIAKYGPITEMAITEPRFTP
jgi:predicted Zn-dependent peptidase